jgi:hypothetical protein
MICFVDFPEQQDVTAEWLAEALGHPGVVPGVEQRSIGTGQVGENVRYTLTWPEGTNGPATVVGKFPSPDPTSRETAAATGSYVKEVGFYRDLQDTVSITTPRLFALREDLQANRFLLLMEDIDPAEQGDQITGCSVERAQLAVDAIVGLHAPRWADPTLNELEWLTPREPERGDELAALYAMLFPGFADRYGQRLGSEVIVAGEDFGGRLADWFRAFVTPTTLVHGDYRLDNMLFATGPGPAPLTVVDWQTAAIGHGPSDVAYFVGAGLLHDERREVETDLVARYTALLQAEGIDVDQPTIVHDYSLGTASGLLMAVVASMIVGRTERGDEMFCVMAERHAAQMRDWACLDRIAG